MKKILPLLFLLIFFVSPAYPQQQQENKLLFSNALATYLPKYEKKAKQAYYHRDFEEAKQLFDTLVDHHLKGTTMDDFQVYRLNGRPVHLNDFEKPLYLITYASWCVPTPGEIPAINKLAKKYKNQVDFVILFWDTQKTTQELAKSYNKNITVVYVNEMNNQDSFVITNLKHSLGLPTTFLLAENKQILDIKREVTHPYGISATKSFDMNYDAIKNGIADELLHNSSFSKTTDPVAVK